jgi:predicted nucleotide-binding protein
VGTAYCRAMDENGQPGSSPILAIVPDDIADELVENDLASIVPGMRHGIWGAALTVVTSAAVGTTAVVLAQARTTPRAVADVLHRRARAGTDRLDLRVRTGNGDRTIRLRDATPEVVRNVIGAVYAEAQEAPAPTEDVTRKVFVIFGRDIEVNKKVFDLLRALGLEPIEWEQLMRAAGNPLAHINQAVATGLTAGAAQAVVALFTPDDMVMLHPQLGDDHAAPLFQPRPNVLIELGRAMTSFPTQTVVVEVGRHLRPITDLAGLSVVRFDGADLSYSIAKLRERLRQAGCPAGERGTDWADTSRFADLDAYSRRPSFP